MIYHNGKPQAQQYTGLEHLLPHQSAFHWRKPSMEGVTFDLSTLDLSKLDTAGRHAFTELVRHKRKRGLSVEEATNKVLRMNKYSDLAVSTRGASDRAAQIRKGGVM